MPPRSAVSMTPPFGRAAGARPRLWALDGSRPGTPLANAPAADHRVVVIDNDPLSRVGMRALLAQQEGARVLDDLVDVDTALARLPDIRPDVALVEATLAAEHDGACIHAILRSVPGVRVIAFGTGSREEEIFRVLAAGAAGYLLRSAAERELARAIRCVERGVRYIPPEVEATLRRRQLRRELTPRETDVLRFLARARSNAAIAASLGITLGTVKLHVKSIMAKLGVEDRAEAALVAIERGFAPPA